ncbi:MAG: SAM-dependent methyltransferase [Candidatus Promineifilaceae bacterium]
MNKTEGALVVVGSGIQVRTQITTQALAFIKDANKVFYIIPDRLGDAWMLELNPSAESLAPIYQSHNKRLNAYQAIVEHILEPVRRGLNVCAVFYGHPGVFVLPGHEAIKQARSEGYRAWMCPGISAEDCLFADLGIDPATYGCQTYEATDFLLNAPPLDTRSHLVLWQVGAIGNTGQPKAQKVQGIYILTEVLLTHYPADHVVTVYEAPPHPDYGPRIHPTPLSELPAVKVTSISTLSVPPCRPKTPDPTMLARLGLNRDEISKSW